MVGNARAGFAPKHPFCREDPGRRTAHVAQVLFALCSGFSLPTTQAETQHYSAIATAGRQPIISLNVEIVIICLATAPNPVHNLSLSLLARVIFSYLQVLSDSNWPPLPGCCFHFNNTAPNKWPRVAISGFLPVWVTLSRENEFCRLHIKRDSATLIKNGNH